MKTCPNCGELVGDRVESCFTCSYNFVYKRVVKKDELIALNQEREEAIQQAKEEQLERNRRSVEVNDLYEYDIRTISHREYEQFDIIMAREIINSYAEQGWRMCSSYSYMVKVWEPSKIVNVIVHVFWFERCVHRRKD